MIQLCADWISATLQVLSKLPDVLRLRSVPPAVVGEAQPAGAGVSSDSAAGTGGQPSWHPSSWTDSELLSAAAELLCWLPSHPGLGPRSVEGADNIRRELNHRAAQFRAEND